MWSLWRVARAFASALVIMTALYYVVVAFDNITNPSSNWPFVRGVLSGDGTPPDDGFEWREIDAHWFAVASYVAIIVDETLAGLAMLYAGIQGLRRTTSPQRWADAQKLAVVGAGIGLLVFYLGFITIGGNWFIMYLNGTWNGLDPAFQNTVTTLFTFVVVAVVAIGGRTEDTT